MRRSLLRFSKNNRKFSSIAKPGIIGSLQNNGFLVDSYPKTWNIQKSKGSWLVDNESGTRYLDFNGGCGSNPLGWNHPKLVEEMSKVDVSLLSNKPANGDFYTKELAEFVESFKTNVVPSEYDHLFFVDGGALAVENTFKVAMDWKSQKVGKDATDILHLQHAFHGRSGYTMSVTNTDPHKVKRFPKFDWPRVPNPPALHATHAIGTIMSDNVTCTQDYMDLHSLNTFSKIIHKRGADNIAALIIEPIQCEGGDRYFTKTYLQGLQTLCAKHDILFIVDEVQTGFFTTGKPWCFQHYDLKPDLVSFGKKTQQCGIFGGNRVNEIKENCFNVSGRLNSTWSGNLTDMIRSTKITGIVLEDQLAENATKMGDRWAANLKSHENRVIDNVRNLGLLMAFDCETTKDRDEFVDVLYKKYNLLALTSGTNTVRFRPHLAVKEQDIDTCVERIVDVIEDVKFKKNISASQ